MAGPSPGSSQMRQRKSAVDGSINPGDEVCKEIDCDDNDSGTDDGILNVGDEIDCDVEIDVDNDSGSSWTSLRVKDHFGAEWEETGGIFWRLYRWQFHNEPRKLW